MFSKSRILEPFSQRWEAGVAGELEKVDTPLQRVFDLFVWVCCVLRIQPRALQGKYATSPGPNYLMSSKNIIVHL